MTHRIFLNFFPESISRKFIKPMRGYSRFLLKFFPKLPSELEKYKYGYTADEYISLGSFSYSILAFVMGMAFFTLFFRVSEIDPLRSAFLGFLLGFVVYLLLMFLGVNHPKSEAHQNAIEIERYLLYALRDFSLQISSGRTIFESLINGANADYGAASREFSFIVKEINVGVPMDKVLKRGIERTNSEFLQKTYWTILNSMYSGADLRRGISSIINDLDYIQKSRIQNYARELSLWSLIYMMAAVAVPTIGMTMMVILSAFADFGLTEASFYSFLVIIFLAQAGLIALVKSRRPVVDF